MRLLLLAASGLLPLVIVLAWGLNHLVEERRTEAERATLELSRALATAVDAELRSIVSLLDHIGYSSELEAADLRSFQLTGIRTASELGWLYVGLADSEGRVLLRTSEPFGTSNPAPSDTKSMARVVSTLAPVVSEVIEAPKLPSDAFIVRVPVMRGGKLVYVISAALPTSAVLTILTRQNIPRGTVATVLDQSNRRVARSLQNASREPAPSLRALLARGNEQGVGRTVTLEGVDSYSGYTRLPRSGWTVAVGSAVAAVNEGLYALLQAVALGLAASLALAVFLAWVLSRHVLQPIEALKDAAVALGRGAPVHLPPLDIEELDDVALALVGAAADRDRAAAQIQDALRTAEEANRTKDQFLAVLGHELRNPLAPIATAVRLMALKGDDKTAPERHVIERQLFHVTRLVDDLLDVSRITSGRLALKREPVCMGQMLQQVVDAIKQSVYHQSLTLELAPGVDDAWVSGDEVRLVQVLNNLLVNAIKFTPGGGSIRVQAAVEGAEVRVDVVDSGVGVPQQELDRIFELFYQAPQKSDRARGGLGLGLPIVRSLVEMHGGTVRASSEGTGQGCRMTVRLPLCEAPAPSEIAAPAPETRGTGRVLVVDDNEDAADTCGSLLEMSGYVVRVAYTPDSALATLGEFTPDVAILDIGLPGMTGHELASRMKAPPYNYEGRLVALTGYGQAGDIATSEAAGFDAHRTKPVPPSTLLKLLDELMRPVREDA